MLFFDSPVICPLRSDKCYNSVIPFSRYINHLHGYHGVKLFRELNHIHKFFVKTRDDRLVRGKPGSLARHKVIRHLTEYTIIM